MFRRMRQRFGNDRFNNVLLKNFLALNSFVLIIALLFCIFTFIYFRELVNREISDLSSVVYASFARRLDDICANTNRTVNHLIADSEVIQFLSQGFEAAPDSARRDVVRDINNTIQMHVSFLDELNTIHIYSVTQGYVLSNKGSGDITHFYDNTFLRELEARPDFDLSYEIRQVNNVDKQGWFMTYAKRYTEKGQTLGYIVVNVDMDDLYETQFQTINEVILDFMVFEGEDVVISRQQMGMISVEEPEVRVIRFPQAAYHSRWHYGILVNMEIVQSHVMGMLPLMGSFLLVLVLCCMGIAYYITVRLFRPVNELIHLIDDPNDWLLEEKMIERGKFNEYKHIAKNVLDNFSDNQAMKQSLSVSLASLKQAQAIALQTQINPHFLFNTLHVISLSASELTGGDNAVTEIVEELAKLLRMSYETKNQFISVGEELAYAKIYVKLLKYRYDDKFEVTWQVDESLLGYQTVRLVLQPLIENAVYHGIKPLPRNGKLTVSVFSEEGKLMMEVADDGVGMTPETLSRLEDMCEEGIIAEDTHLGVANVNMRVRLAFGADYGVRAANRAGGGAVFRIVMPLTAQLEGN